MPCFALCLHKFSKETKQLFSNNFGADVKPKWRERHTFDKSASHDSIKYTSKHKLSGAFVSMQRAYAWEEIDSNKRHDVCKELSDITACRIFSSNAQEKRGLRDEWSYLGRYTVYRTSMNRYSIYTFNAGCGDWLSRTQAIVTCPDNQERDATWWCHLRNRQSSRDRGIAPE